jgi:hypothetical protein
MTKLINRNNKQSGGTFVTIKPDDGEDGIITDDDQVILSGLFAESNSIKCINYSSVFSIVFVCELPNVDTKIKLHSEVNPEKVIRKFCIKITLVKTQRIPVNTSRLVFKYNGKEFEKESVSENDATKECTTQKTAHDKLLKRCHKNVISDTIAAQTVTPEIFQTYTETIFKKKQTEQTEQTDKDETLTKSAIKWLIDTANQYHFNIHVFMMDFLGGYTPFSQVLWPLEDSPTTMTSDTIEVDTYHSTGYYSIVYKFVESAAGAVIGILGITGDWNQDLNSGNILVSQEPFDTKVIDFGMNINLQENSERLEILRHFTNYNNGLLRLSLVKEQTNLINFLDSLTGEPTSKIRIPTTFSSCYQKIITNIATDIELLLNRETPLESKRQIVFQVLMFLAFIDGLLIKQKFQRNGLQCRELMKYVFNCDIFDSLSKFYRVSSLQYNHAFLEKVFAFRIKSIKTINVEQYEELCNTILDNICNNVIRLLSVTCERRVGVGGTVISKKISAKRHPRRKSSTIKRHPRRKSSTIKRRLRRRRTSRK